MRVRVVGPGRAGGSLALALAARGVEVEVTGRSGVAGAGHAVDLVLVCVPDAAVREVVEMIEPTGAVVAHVAGSLPLDVLTPHTRRGSVHPLMALPDATLGSRRLIGGWFAVDGSDEPTLAMVRSLVSTLEGRAVRVTDEHRVAYHAAAVMASNHLVGLLAAVERVAAEAGVPLEAYLDLVRATVENVAALGPAAALTGPVVRGDWGTVTRHLAALAPQERAGYLAGMAEAARAVGVTPPPFEEVRDV